MSLSGREAGELGRWSTAYPWRRASYSVRRDVFPVGSRRRAGGRPDVLYWLGRASPDALVLGDGPASEVRPGDLVELLEGDGDAPPGGLVFLNACRTAEVSPSAGSFFRAVFGLRMGG